VTQCSQLQQFVLPCPCIAANSNFIVARKKNTATAMKNRTAAMKVVLQKTHGSNNEEHSNSNEG